MSRTKLLPLVFLTGLLLISCGGASRMYINEEADMGFYTRVGVIPFTNLTSERNASEKVTSSFITELLKLEAVDVATMGDFTKIVSDVVKGGLTNSLEDLTSEQARIIGEQTNVEGIFVGAVQDYGMVRSGQEQFPLVSVIVRFIDAPTGRVVWSYEVTKKGGPKFPIFSFGETHTLGAMTTKVTSEIARSFGRAAK